VITPNAADTAFVTNFQITNIMGGNLFLNDGSTPVINGQFITVAQAAAGLKFTPAVNSINSGSFTVQKSNSATSTGLAGPTATATVTVEPIIVTTLSDTETTGQTTLRDAINQANYAVGKSDTITFKSSLFANNTPGTIALTQGELTITNSMTIIGPGANLLTISGNNSSRVFTIDDGNSAITQTVAMSGLTITDGNGIGANAGNGGAIDNQENLTLTNAVLSYNAATNDGGAIWTNGGLDTNNVSFVGNGADYGANVWNAAAPPLPGGASIASSMVVPDGTVFDLSTGGALYDWTGPGASWIQLAGNTSSLQVDSNGTMYALLPLGGLYSWTLSGGWSAVASNVSS